ncbi:MAG: hypothetical protein HC941_04280 [Microcoleus sp. SU_5_3]|nr:hypothetical protein [Microcoleus sp. SU_5_3]
MNTNAKDVTVNKNELNNWVFIGRGYDILKINPLDLDEAASYNMVFDLKATEPTSNEEGLKPPEVLFVPDSGGNYSSDTKEMFSSYDIQNYFKLAASVGVSDPTGALFSFSLSGSYENAAREIGEKEQVLTYTKLLVKKYRLQLDDSKPKQLGKTFKSLVEKLPQSASELIEKFGTHYSHEVHYGGQAHYTLVFNREEYATMNNNEIDVKSQATGAFQVVKLNASVETCKDLNQEFRNKIKNKHEAIDYSGGTIQKDFDAWVTSVKDDPAPIYIGLVPLYDLVNENYFQGLPDIKEKRNKLKDAIDKYIETGVNPSQSLICYGDELQLSLVANRGEKRYLSTEMDVHYTVTKAAPPGISGAQLPTAKWQILPVNATDMEEIVKVGDVVLLKRGSSQKYLDAQSGRDDEYYPGDGLTSADESDPQKESVKWKLELAYDTDRKEIVEGDFVKLQTLWQNSDNEYGYLQGEFDPKEPKQRVVFFWKWSSRQRQ